MSAFQRGSAAAAPPSSSQITYSPRPLSTISDGAGSPACSIVEAIHR
jgi:hypothetical protein